MRILFYVFAFIDILDSFHIKKETDNFEKKLFKIFTGGWLIYYALFFVMFWNFKDMQQWIGICIYLFVAYRYWKVWKIG